MPEILELDLNPVIALAAGQGCRIVHARVKVGRRTPARATGGLSDARTISGLYRDRMMIVLAIQGQGP